MSDIYFTPYRVSTITCNADLAVNTSLDLSILFHKFTIDTDYNSFIWIQYLKDDGENTRGVYPKRRRKSKTVQNKKCRFDNQITVIYKHSDECMPNVKIFRNGNIQLTGIRDTNLPTIIGHKIIADITRIYNDVDKNVITSSNNDDPVSQLSVKNFKIRMINTDFKIYEDALYLNKFNIKRKELHNLLISQNYNNKSSFQPGIYQGVKLEYFWNTASKNKNGICACTNNCFGKNNGTGNGNCKKITIAIFESGSILITGGITFQQVDDAYEYICGVIKQNRKQIRKQMLIDLLAADGF
jgi:TATA-box binding protein (TBP) (component of TFIID and TFIIIB)